MLTSFFKSSRALNLTFYSICYETVLMLSFRLDIYISTLSQISYIFKLFIKFFLFALKILEGALPVRQALLVLVLQILPQ